MGAQGVFIPNIQSKADAEAAVRNAKYHPFGQRGLGPYGRWARLVSFGPRTTRTTEAHGMGGVFTGGETMGPGEWRTLRRRHRSHPGHDLPLSAAVGIDRPSVASIGKEPQ